MLVARRFSTDPTIHLTGPKPIAHAQHILRRYLDKRPLAAYPRGGLSPAVVSAQVEPTLRRLQPDLVHLHWVADGFIRPEQLATWRLPLVWTLRDHWAMTGGCHMPPITLEMCRRYEQCCGACPALESQDEDDLSRQGWRRKQRAYSICDLTVVGISAWIANSARQSSLLGQFPIEVIPNTIDTDLCTPQNTSHTRHMLGLPMGDRIVLFGALDAVRDKRKGYQLLVDALRQLSQTWPGQPLRLVVFGSAEGTGNENLPYPITFLGHITDDRRLTSIYSAADVAVFPSLIEPFGKTGAEALACGTPVVAFEDTGLADVTEHQVCGYLAPYGDSAGIAAGIQYVLEDADRLDRLSQNARKRAVELFSFANVAARYQALYASILERRRYTPTGADYQERGA